MKPKKKLPARKLNLKPRVSKKSDKIDLQVLRDYLDTLDLKKENDLNFWIYCNIAMKTGLRYSDISTLRNSDYNHLKKELHVVERKTFKVSIIPFDMPQVTKYFKTTELLEPVIWSSKYSCLISLMTINRRLKAVFGTSAAISSHSIRKSCAAMVYAKTNNDIYATMKFLNHSSIETTRKYLSLDETERKSLYSLL